MNKQTNNFISGKFGSTKLNFPIPSFHSFPREIEREYYLELRKKFGEKLLSANGVKNVFSCGNIDMPGISDLDFFVITDSIKTDWCKIRGIYNSLDGMDKYIAGLHPPFFTSDKIGTNFKYILPLSNLTDIENDTQSDPSSTLTNDEILLILGEGILQWYPFIFYNRLRTGIFPVRDSFMALKGFRFPLNFLLSLNICTNTDKITTYLDEINSAKSSFLSIPKEEQCKIIIDLYLKALDICHDIIIILSSYLYANNYIIGHKISSDHSFNTVFKKNWSSKYQKKSHVLQNLLNIKVMYYPQNFELFSRKINLDDCNMLPIKIKSAIEQRERIIHSQKQYINENQICDLLVYPPYLRDIPSLKKKIVLNLLSRV